MVYDYLSYFVVLLLFITAATFIVFTYALMRNPPHAAKEKPKTADMFSSMTVTIPCKTSGMINAPAIQLRDIPYEQALEEIAAYFRENDGRVIYYDELLLKLGIDIFTIVKACDELERSGKIKHEVNADRDHEEQE